MVKTPKSVKISGGYDLVMELFSPYRLRIYDYNTQIRDSGYYLKPLHLVYKRFGDRKVKYVYFGRYWYRIYKVPADEEGRRSRLKWIYVGREKPDPALPDPPLNPLEGLAIIVEGKDIFVDENTFEALVKISMAILGENLFE
ncbi:MAG: hypothetical protein DRO10_02205 [Thermoprotei archaeon]|nr:MAG: hypothetical protein DRO10_02205 [Thermoprotei archaeon]HDN01792.1 hypothetical protein [Candidatus Bathyarchaeota archaeon]